MAEAKQVKEQLEKEENRLQFTEKVGPDGRTFGSITAKKIAEGLQNNLVSKLINAILNLNILFVRLV